MVINLKQSKIQNKIVKNHFDPKFILTTTYLHNYKADIVTVKKETPQFL